MTVERLIMFYGILAYFVICLCYILKFVKALYKDLANKNAK